jgi:hypothetical protein
MVHRFMELAEQPPKPPYHLVDGQACGGRCGPPQGPRAASGQPGDRTSEPVGLGHRLPTAAPHGVRELLHPPSCGMTLIEEIKEVGEAG